MPQKLIFSKIRALIVVMVVSILFNSINNQLVSASLQGYTSVVSQITSNNSPTISGTIRSWCDDVVIALGTDQMSSSSDYIFFYSDYGQVQLSSGNWTLNLANNGVALLNGVYNIYVVSECNYSGTYSNPLYADLHQSMLSVTPDTCDNLCVPLYRFYNTQNGAHFYTTNENEKRQVLSASQYRFEGIVGFAKYFRTYISGMVAVHRFYNLKQGVHFYTSNQAEASTINNTMATAYRYEGIAYYTYSSLQAGTSAVHRFYKFNQGIHFFTANQAEASSVNATQSNVYRYEGISYYNIVNQ